ncbi:MAG: ABC transporter permease [Ilumatobacteraceae bacterium]
MSETVVESAPVVKADERIAHRGPLQRWLVSPEIGALIGAVIVWSFFWGNARTFGEADSTLNWLDVAAPLGIMAVAIALLMIGGEFDLSSGVMSGATAILIGLMATYFGGDGIHIGWAIGAAFLAAGAVGWFNGFMVNRTGLPSFIVTLATFFVLRGVMLVMSKRLADKVQVAEILDQEGAQTLKGWIAHEWMFTEFKGRDFLFVALVLIGGAAFAYGLLEQSFVRRQGLSLVGMALSVIGLVAAALGFTVLNRTDGVGTNVLWGVVMGVGTLVLALGLSRGRWKSRSERLSGTLERGVVLRVGVGVVGITLACLTPIPLDRGLGVPVLTWVSSGFRPIIAAAAALVGIFLAVRAAIPAIRSRSLRSELPRLLFFAPYCGLTLMVSVLSFFQLSTVQGLRAMAMLALAGGGVVLLMSARGLAGRSNTGWQLGIGLLATLAILVLAFVVRADAGAVRFRTGLFTAMCIGALVIAANTLLEFAMEKRRGPDAKADRLGKRLQFTGFALAAIGMVIRVVWSNLTPEHAERVKAAGGTVGQNVLRQPVVWWLLVAAIGAFVLTKTKWGNWIFAVGGNKEAARAIGVPVEKVKIGLFVVVSLCGCLAGTLIALRYGTVQANQGTGLEFEYIIAAVVGGCLMTGGYGSVIGACLGAAIMAMSTNGVQSTGWNSDGRFAFLGVVLLLAVLVNNYTRKKAQEAR